MIFLPSDMDILLACLRLYLGTITIDEVTGLLSKSIDWKTLIQTSIAQGVMPILYESLKTIEQKYVPRSVMVQLQTLNRMNGLNNLSRVQELLKILLVLEKEGIEAIPFKGPILASCAYGNIALRQYNDLDIIVRKQDFWQAKAVLMNLGYTSKLSEKRQLNTITSIRQISLSHVSVEAEMFNRQFQPSLMHSNLERNIDLHWGIYLRKFLNPDQLERFWQHLVSVKLSNQSVQTFSPEVALIIQCFNLAKDGSRYRSLKQFFDIAQIIKAHPNLNWDLVLDITSELRTSRLCMLWLGIVHGLLGIPLPIVIIPAFNKNQLGYDEATNYDFHQSADTILDLWLRYANSFKTLDGWGDRFRFTVYAVKYLSIKFLLKNTVLCSSLELEDGSP
uniref:Nucleotidyltransferase family protein n=1 Tax=Cyanothece sp. (strain PCC 7425 / ATCC 29141) TaxID=395961 RepID=B8HPX3_CYAP4